MKLSNKITKYLSKEAQSLFTEEASSFTIPKTTNEQMREAQAKTITPIEERVPSSINMYNGGLAGR